MAAKRSASKSSKAPVKKAAAKAKKAPPPKPKPARPPMRSSRSFISAVPARKGAFPEIPLNSNGKPKKPEVSRLSKSDLTHFRDLLLEKRREILGDVGSMESEAFKSGSNLSNMPIHMADVGTDNFEQEFTLGLIESERQILREIQEALNRIENGTYAICIATGKPISKMRLEAVPWAKYTMEYARALEQGLVGRDEESSDDETESDDEDE